MPTQIADQVSANLAVLKSKTKTAPAKTRTTVSKQAARTMRSTPMFPQYPEGPVWPTDFRSLNDWVHAGHTAWDIAVKMGGPVYAIFSGTIVATIPMDSRGYGNLIIERLDSGELVYYAHNSKFKATVGERVEAGEQIGYAGSTGRSTGPHVHLEIRDPSGKRILNPDEWFKGKKWTMPSNGESFTGKMVAGMGPDDAPTPVEETDPEDRPAGPAATPDLFSSIMSGTFSPAAADSVDGSSQGITLLESPLLGALTIPAPAGGWWNVVGIILGGILVLLAFGGMALGAVFPEKESGDKDKSESKKKEKD